MRRKGVYNHSLACSEVGKAREYFTQYLRVEKGVSLELVSKINGSTYLLNKSIQCVQRGTHRGLGKSAGRATSRIDTRAEQ